jgi:hypothetical protein
MICRGPCLLPILCFGSSPASSLPLLSVVSLSQYSCVSLVELTDRRGWGKSQIPRRRESLVLYTCKSFNARSGRNTHSVAEICPIQLLLSSNDVFNFLMHIRKQFCKGTTIVNGIASRSIPHQTSSVDINILHSEHTILPLWRVPGTFSCVMPGT